MSINIKPEQAGNLLKGKCIWSCIKILICCVLSLWVSQKMYSQLVWESIEIVKEGRIDAIADCGKGVLLAGTRKPNPGFVFRSMDYGKSWTKISVMKIEEDPQGITCIACHEGRAYLLTEGSDFFTSEDLGDHWKHITRLSKGENTEGFALSYGIWVTNKGTILVSDTHSAGGRVYRSTDSGESFRQIPSFSDRALYRFEGYEDLIFVNGWAGTLYRSEDDGLTWRTWAKLDETPLYATAATNEGIILQGSEAGNIFLVSALEKSRFTSIDAPGSAADDFVYLDKGGILFSTYTDEKYVFYSNDNGRKWKNTGKVNPEVPGDWLDHVILIHQDDQEIAIGGTNKGFIVRTLIE